MLNTFFPVLSLMARILLAFSVTFLVPGIWAWFEDHHDLQWIWLAGFGLTAASGLLLAAITQRHRRELLAKDGFLLVNMVWLVLPAYSALPLMFLVPDISWFKAYFEAMSALTATGATALSGLEHLPVSVNIWRCFLQLIGGLGIMLLVVAVLPMLGLGGFSSYDAIFAHFNSPLIEGVAIVFMTLAGISFLRYFVVLRTLSLKPVTNDHEIRTYFGVLLLSTLLLTGLLMANGVYSDWPQALRASAFHVVSLATTTGYAATDYALWPAFAPVMLMFLGCFVSCAGSTGGGIKMVRMILLVKQARRELVRIIHPRVINPVTLGGGIMPMSVMTAVLGFMLIYGGATMGLSMLLLLSGMDIVTAFSAVIATVNNIGPGLGEVGPSGNFGGLNPFQLSVLSFAMLLGRLELLSVLVLFSSHFWRK